MESKFKSDKRGEEASASSPRLSLLNLLSMIPRSNLSCFLDRQSVVHIVSGRTLHGYAYAARLDIEPVGFGQDLIATYISSIIIPDFNDGTA